MCVRERRERERGGRERRVRKEKRTLMRKRDCVVELETEIEKDRY